MHTVDLVARRKVYKQLLADTLAQLDGGGRDMWTHQYIQLSHRANYYDRVLHHLEWNLHNDLWWWPAWRWVLSWLEEQESRDNKKTQ